MLQSIPLRKLVIELRYEPDLRFYGKMDDVAFGFSNLFPDWERSPLTVEVRNKKKHRRIFLAHRRCFFESDLDSRESENEFDFALDQLGTVCNKLQFTELKRVGVRQWIAADLDKPFALMVDELGSRFLSQNTELAKILNDKVTDLAYVVDYESVEGWKYHLRLGPMTRDEWFHRLQYDRNMFEENTDADDAPTFEVYRRSIPDNLLCLDVDCYQEDVQASQLKDRITTFRRRSHDLISRLIQYSRG